MRHALLVLADPDLLLQDQLAKIEEYMTRQGDGDVVHIFRGSWLVKTVKDADVMRKEIVDASGFDKFISLNLAV